MRKAQIISTGSYAPENVVTNAYFDKSLGVNVSEWLEEVVKIHERRWIADDQATSDLCVEAANLCLEKAGVSAEQIDLIVVATDTPDYISPSTASVVQHKLGARNAGTFDINTACAGFVTALDLGAKYIAADKKYEYILVFGAYAMSRYLDKTDKKTVTLFADGAGVVLLKATEEEEGFLASELRSKGEYAEYMGIYGGGTAQPMDQEVLDNKDHKLKFVHKFPPELNPNVWSDMIRHLNKQTGAKSEDVDKFFMTQININSIWETMDILNLPREKAHTIMHYYGYTGSACIPMALDDAMQKGLVGKGDLVYFIGSGGGLAFASAAFRL